VFGDDFLKHTSCDWPGHSGGAGGDCARAWMCDDPAVACRYGPWP